MSFVNRISHYFFGGAGTRTIRDTNASKLFTGTGTVSRFSVLVKGLGFFMSELFVL